MEVLHLVQHTGLHLPMFMIAILIQLMLFLMTIAFDMNSLQPINHMQQVNQYMDGYPNLLIYEVYQT